MFEHIPGKVAFFSYLNTDVVSILLEEFNVRNAMNIEAKRDLDR